MTRGRPCSVCGHPKIAAITTMLINGSPVREVARAFNVGQSSMSRHRIGCMAAPSSNQVIKQRAAGAMALAALPSRDEAGLALGGIGARLDGIIARCEADGSAAVAINGLRELKSVVIAQAQLAGHLGRGETQVNVAVKNEINVDLGGMVKELVTAITSLPSRDAAIDRLADIAGLSGAVDE